jgi:hypothetical protein
MNRHEAICRALGGHIDKRQAADLVDALERLCVLKLDTAQRHRIVTELKRRDENQDEPDFLITHTPKGDAFVRPAEPTTDNRVQTITYNPGQPTANMPDPGEWFWSKDGCWAPVKPSYSGGGGGGGNSSTERKLSPAEALARVQLGPEYGPGHQWQVGFGPMGADRLLRALADAGYEVVERQPSLERRMSTKSKA